MQEKFSNELQSALEKLKVEEKERKDIECEMIKLKKIVPENDNNFEVNFMSLHMQDFSLLV